MYAEQFLNFIPHITLLAYVVKKCRGPATTPGIHLFN